MWSRAGAVLTASLLCAVLADCGSGEPPGGGSADLDRLVVAAGETRQLDVARLNVAGDAVIDGELLAADGRLILHVAGNLTLNGRVAAGDGAAAEIDRTQPLGEQPGVILIVEGTVQCGAEAAIESAGVLVCTDDESTLVQSLGDLEDEARSLTTGQPAVALPTDRQPRRTVTWSGRMTAAGAAGAVFEVHEAETDLRFEEFRLEFAREPPLPPLDTSGAPGTPANAVNGRAGGPTLVLCEQGSIQFAGAVLWAAAGQPGQDAVAVCAQANAGDGGQAGPVHISSRDGLEFAGAGGVFNPGPGGDGGDARSTGLPAADGCPGADGCDAFATGGFGAGVAFTLQIAGPADDLDGLVVGHAVGGRGGDATAVGGDGGAGDDCCAGGHGGRALAVAGNGGRAALEVDPPVGSVGATGGQGGAASASGGRGGPGGDCAGSGGAGGAGGAAEATSGAGGQAEAPDTNTHGGWGGDVTAVGGDGGDGGGSPGAAGAGGAGGAASATPGAFGAGATPGQVGTVMETPGEPGRPGAGAPPELLCLNFDELPAGPLADGLYTGTLRDNHGRAVATIDYTIEFGGTARHETAPVDFLRVAGGALELRIVSIEPALGREVTGLRLVFLTTDGLDGETCVEISPLGDIGGITLDYAFVCEAPDNSGRPDDPVPLDLEPWELFGFPMATTVIRVPPVVTLDLMALCLPLG